MRTIWQCKIFEVTSFPIKHYLKWSDFTKINFTEFQPSIKTFFPKIVKDEILNTCSFIKIEIKFFGTIWYNFPFFAGFWVAGFFFFFWWTLFTPSPEHKSYVILTNPLSQPRHQRWSSTCLLRYLTFEEHLFEKVKHLFKGGNC